MDKISTIRDLVNLWPARSALAGDINDIAGAALVTLAQVHKWAENQSIPAKYHHFVVVAAGRRGFPVTADLIVRLHAEGARPRKGAA